MDYYILDPYKHMECTFWALPMFCTPGIQEDHINFSPGDLGNYYDNPKI